MTGSDAATSPQFTWPTWLATAPEWWITATSIVGAFLAAIGGAANGRARVAFFILGGVVLIASILITCARAQRRSLLKQIGGTDMNWVLDERLGPLLQTLAETVATYKPAERKQMTSVVRSTAVQYTANMVGGFRQNSTRANLFKITGSGDDRVMRLVPGCFAGRGDKSTRTFPMGHPTMTATLANRFQFVQSVAEECPEERGLPYAQFMTVPISACPERIWGVLTIDCPGEDQLDQHIDLPIMRVFAAVIALAYECEVYGEPTQRMADALKSG